MPDLRNDTGPVALPQAQGARQAGGGGQTSAGGPGGVLRQVLGRSQGHLQTGERGINSVSSGGKVGQQFRKVEAPV